MHKHKHTTRQRHTNVTITLLGRHLTLSSHSHELALYVRSTCFTSGLATWVGLQPANTHAVLPQEALLFVNHAQQEVVVEATEAPCLDKHEAWDSRCPS